MDTNLNELDEKIRSVFPYESVMKQPGLQQVFSGYNLPSFVKDWLLQKHTEIDGSIDTDSLKDFLTKHIAYKGSKIKGQLINDGSQVTLLARIIVEPDVKSGILRFSIPDIDIKSNEARIPPHIAREHSSELSGGETWGVVTLVYVPPDGRTPGAIELADYKPFKPYEVDLDYFRERRKEFTLEEWIDLLIRSMEYNPRGFRSLSQKLLFISRLLVFVEPNLNMMELAPKGTGKSYTYSNLTKYGWIISGGTVTRAKLFYDISKQMPGILTQYDFVAMDEVETIRFSDESELLGALKNYLESGRFTVGNYNGVSSAGMVLLGNIPLSHDKTPLSSDYLATLPPFFKNSALLDRFHGFIEGWKLPRMREDMKVRGHALNVEYFSEILHEMRTVPDFADICKRLLRIPENSDTRDTKAIVKLSTAYLKLLFSHVRDITDISKEEFQMYCLTPAKEMRQIIKRQLAMIDREFSEELPNIEVVRQ
ncbi:BREX system Lon protease-like protein BrxL [Fervidobacterium gondwanense]|uniref:ATP-dependent Lon protease n=1 Tax=Fervidobacterium gondwanense DSM 13020 TaxID=1121883 RepID=A0A1M7T7C5_FERGO|nr:BREX system Lon protease-like protein BrxL [Fervidobacterium gondwanense]SHN66532.1 ATP-dependent Lon protease [Fervidobacterium gondwanense DSM 13020]